MTEESVRGLHRSASPHDGQKSTLAWSGQRTRRILIGSLPFRHRLNCVQITRHMYEPNDNLRAPLEGSNRSKQHESVNRGDRQLSVSHQVNIITLPLGTQPGVRKLTNLWPNNTLRCVPLQSWKFALPILDSTRSKIVGTCNEVRQRHLSAQLSITRALRLSSRCRCTRTIPAADYART